MNGNLRLIECRGEQSTASEAARVVLDAMPGAGAVPCGLALSGGRIAPAFFAEFARQGRLRRVPLCDGDYFFADERCVRADHPDSNFRLAEAGLFRVVGAEAGRIHRLCGELVPTDAAAMACADWARWCDGRPAGHGARLDCAVLGVGEDGHVASLFPGNIDADTAAKEAFRAVRGPKPPPERLTMGYRLLWEAGLVVVIASGAGKERVVRGGIEGAVDSPFARVLQGRRERNRATLVVLNVEA